jgi:hypothetical protein
VERFVMRQTDRSVCYGRLVIAGVVIVLISASARSIVGFFIGTAVAGAGFGGGFQGGLRTTVPLAEPTERAGVISVAYIICYLATGLPAILAGFRSSTARCCTLPRSSALP